MKRGCAVDPVAQKLGEAICFLGEGMGRFVP